MNVQTHECGCATFGPGPHPVDARHPNARSCEHAEEARALLREPEFAALEQAAQEVVTRWFDWIEGEADQTLRAAMIRLRAALQAEPARAEADLATAADDVRHGRPMTDYWRGFNDGVDALVAALGAAQEKGEAG